MSPEPSGAAAARCDRSCSRASPARRSSVVIARSYSRYSGSTTDESETKLSGSARASSSPTRLLVRGLAYACRRQTATPRPRPRRARCTPRDVGLVERLEHVPSKRAARRPRGRCSGTSRAASPRRRNCRSRRDAWRAISSTSRKPVVTRGRARDLAARAARWSRPSSRAARHVRPRWTAASRLEPLRHPLAADARSGVDRVLMR